MNTEVKPTNPVVKAIAEGTAPKPAQLAAARGILPLPQTDLVEALVILAKSEDKELSETAGNTLKSKDENQLKTVISSAETAPHVLDYFATRGNFSQEICEAVIANPNTPGDLIIEFVRNTSNGELLEVLTFNQQLLIKNPAIIDAVIANPHRTAEADRRAAEIKREFFEKERGAQQIANELKAQGKTAAAEFIESAEFAAEDNVDIDNALFLAGLIEVSDSEVDDSWLLLEYVEEIYEETDEQRQAAISKILGELKAENDGEIAGERISMISQIMSMNIKDRVKMAMKGNREARMILIRDPNKIVAQAVIQNPKITEQEVEGAAKMRTVPEDVLRQIAINRKWARNYVIFHNLALNPRTPVGNAMNILPRLQLRDLISMTKNRNVPDAIRKHAQRLSNARVGR
ncbi:MAG: hypothetical protein ACR2MD_04395 [Aridibacter sp.]